MRSGIPKPASADYIADGEGLGDRDISSGATISILIAAIALVGLLVVVVLLLRSRPTPDREDRLARAVDDMRTRMEDLGRDLSEALERAERESKRNRFLSDLGNSIEFEELCPGSTQRWWCSTRAAAARPSRRAG